MAGLTGQLGPGPRPGARPPGRSGMLEPCPPTPPRCRSHQPRAVRMASIAFAWSAWGTSAARPWPRWCCGTNSTAPGWPAWPKWTARGPGTGTWASRWRGGGAARESRGGQPMDRRAGPELDRRGYDGSAHRARQFQPSWFGQRDLVLALDRSNLADLRDMAPDADAAGPRLLLLRAFDPALAGPAEQAAADPYQGEVPDPYGGQPGDYALALDLVQAAVRGLTGRLAGLLDVPATGAGGG